MNKPTPERTDEINHGALSPVHATGLSRSALDILSFATLGRLYVIFRHPGGCVQNDC